MKWVKKSTESEAVSGNMIILKLFLAFLSGLAGHQTFKPTVGFGLRWGGMMRSAIGALIYLPNFSIVKSSIPHHEKDGFWHEVGRDFVSGLLAFLAIGGGVFLGHLMDRHNPGDENE